MGEERRGRSDHGRKQWRCQRDGDDRWWKIEKVSQVQDKGGYRWRWIMQRLPVLECDKGEVKADGTRIEWCGEGTKPAGELCMVTHECRYWNRSKEQSAGGSMYGGKWTVSVLGWTPFLSQEKKTGNVDCPFPSNVACAVESFSRLLFFAMCGGWMDPGAGRRRIWHLHAFWANHAMHQHNQIIHKYNMHCKEKNKV